jgi:hypothetical protein
MSSPSGGWLHDLGFWVTDSATGGGGAIVGHLGPLSPQPFAAGHSGPAPTEGFSLSRAEAESMLAQAKRTADDVLAMRPNAEKLTRMKVPADDIASHGYNASWVGNGQGNPGAGGYALGHVNKEYQYLTELVQRLERALGITADTDQQAGTDINKAPGTGGIA